MSRRSPWKEDEVSPFIDFVLSEEGQESVLGQGFIPVKDEDR